MISVAVVFTLAIFVPSPTGIRLPSDSAPTKSFSQLFAKHRVTVSSIQRRTYSSDSIKNREFARTQSSALSEVNIATSMKTFKLASATLKYDQVGDNLYPELQSSAVQSSALQSSAMRSLLRADNLFIDFLRREVSQLPQFLSGVQGKRSKSKRDESATDIARRDDISSQFRTQRSSENGTKIMPLHAAVKLDSVKPNASIEPELGTNALSSELQSASSRILGLNEKSFRIVPPVNETDVEIGVTNSTFTERFVYAPDGSSLVVPCSVGMNTHAPFSQFNWTRGVNGTKPVPFSSRISQGTNNEMIFETLLKSDAGLYICSANLKEILYQNHVKLHVFSVADLAIGIPFVFRVVQCSEKQSSAILREMNRIIERRFGLDRFIISTSCVSTPWYDQKPGETHPSELKILALKRTNVRHVDSKCNTECVMNSKLRDILSDGPEIAKTLVEIGQRVSVNDNCFSADCGATYIFEPSKTVEGIRLVYICDAGYILFRTSACEPCFPGTFAARSGQNEACTDCPVHHYQSDAGAIDCLPCLNRSIVLSNITGADDVYVCTIREVDNRNPSNLKDILTAFVILLIVSFVATLITTAVAYFIVFYEQRRKSKGLTTLGSKAPEEIQPLKPTKRQSVTSDRKELGRKASVARSVTSGRSTTAPSRTTGSVTTHNKHPSKEVVQEIHNYNELPATTHKPYQTTEPNTTNPPIMTGSVSKKSSGFKVERNAMQSV